MKIIFVLGTLLSGLMPIGAEARSSETIPRPAVVELRSETCRVDSGAEIRCSTAGLENEASYLRTRLGEVLPASASDVRKCRRILLSVDRKLASEGYVLDIRANRIEIRGGSAAGVFYGIQTLLQEMQGGPCRADASRMPPAMRGAGTCSMRPDTSRVLRGSSSCST